MKRLSNLFSLLLVPIDAVLIFVAFVIAYKARANALGFPVIYIWPFDQYLRLALTMVPIWIIAFSFAGLYSTERKTIEQFAKLIAGASLGTMAVVLWVFLFRSDFFSRLIVFYIWALAIICVGIGRAIMGLIEANIYLLGAKKRRLIVVGKNDATTKHLIKQIVSRPELGYNIVGILSNQKLDLDDIEILGGQDGFSSVIKNRKPDEVIIADASIESDTLYAYMRLCQEKGIVFKAVPAHAQVGASTLRFNAFAGTPIIEFKGTPLDGWGLVFKRFIDVIGSALAIVILSPLMLIVAIIVRLDSKGPAIYRNIRTGNRGDFATLKFRTMFADVCTGAGYGGTRAEEYEKKLIEEKNIKKGSAVYKIAGDPRITRVGNFLRKTSLDELPQFFNVFIGNMSLVGPRPHQPREIANYTSEQRKLLLIKPGVTGLAQISGRSDLSFDEEARLDISYLENWSILLDLYIILKTFSAVFKGKGTY